MCPHNRRIGPILVKDGFNEASHKLGCFIGKTCGRWKVVLKSHDYHMLMQQTVASFLLVRWLMAIEPWMSIMRFSHVFRWVCVKVWNLSDIASMWENVAITLSLLEKQFHLIFFDIDIFVVACSRWARCLWTSS